MKIAPTPVTATLAGIFSATVMPILWGRFFSESISLILAFLFVVALPAHAFVVGFGHQQANAGTLDTPLLKRIGAWLAAAVATTVVMQIFRA